VYHTHVAEAEIDAENFVLVSAPPEPDAYPSDDGWFGFVTQGKKTLAKARIF
jgi:hypothetical protein